MDFYIPVTMTGTMTEIHICIIVPNQLSLKRTVKASQPEYIDSGKIEYNNTDFCVIDSFSHVVAKYIILYMHYLSKHYHTIAYLLLSLNNGSS